MATKLMSVQRAEVNTPYPKKVLIPDAYLAGRQHAHLIRQEETNYYYYRDMIWNMIFVERNNPYTGNPYFMYPTPSAHNKYEWSDIKDVAEFKYVIECMVPSNSRNHYEKCFLTISNGVVEFRKLDIYFTLSPIEGMQMEFGFRLDLNFFFLQSRDEWIEKDYLREWLSSIYDSYKVLFSRDLYPKSWEPVKQHVTGKCIEFENYVNSPSNDDRIQ